MINNVTSEGAGAHAAGITDVFFFFVGSDSETQIGRCLIDHGLDFGAQSALCMSDSLGYIRKRPRPGMAVHQYWTIEEGQ